MSDPTTWTEADFDKHERQRSHEYLLALSALGANLAVAAGLHLAFLRGAWYGGDSETISCVGEESDYWSPNVEGRSSWERRPNSLLDALERARAELSAAGEVVDSKQWLEDVRGEDA